MRTAINGGTQGSTELTLIRKFAGASRKLDGDLELSALKAIDRLQELATQFKDHWIIPPWLVLEDCYVLPASMTVAKMLEEIEQHGQPVGIVGLATITSKRWTVFRMNFRADSKHRKTVEQSAHEADRRLKEYMLRVPPDAILGESR